MNNYNIVSPFLLTVESDSKKNAIKKLINDNYINDKNINEYSNQVILEDENKNKFNAKTQFYRKYHSRSHYSPKVKITFIPTTASSIYSFPIYQSPRPILYTSPRPILVPSPGQVLYPSPRPILVPSPVRIIRSMSPIVTRVPLISTSPPPPTVITRPIIKQQFVLPIEQLYTPPSIRTIPPQVPYSQPIISPKIPVKITPSPQPIIPFKPSSPIIRPVAPEININPLLFTSKDIAGITQIDYSDVSPLYLLNPAHFKQYIEPKLFQRRRQLVINNNINTDKYTDIYLTSDIHADYRKLVQILVNAKFIRIPSGINIYSNDIYDPRIISESEWIKPNALFIVIGDLVDGQRFSSVDDNQGSFELLLHLLLYNLKIKAETNNSNVLFTIGNHDLHSVLTHAYAPGKPINILLNYVHSNGLQFFQDEITRCLILSQFYNLSPYLYLNLNNNEIITVHGGLHNPTGKPILNIDELITIQNNINRNGLSEINYNKFENNTISSVTTDNDISIGSLWTRFYAQSEDRQLVCNTVKNNNKNYKFIVVGHCPTDTFSPLNNIMNNDKLYDGCDRLSNNNNSKGCVIVDTCRDENNAPVLAFVDTSLSQAFRKSDNKERHIELLHLSNDASQKQIPGRKYNIISRLAIINNQEPIDIRVY
jgi:hypothetical protein